MPKDLWEHFYKTRGRFYLIPHPDFDRVISKFKAYKVRKVLDLGCGSGRHSIELAQKGFNTIGIDMSAKAIELANKWAKKEELKIKFHVSDFREGLAFSEATFDGAIAIDSIHYDTQESMKMALDELARVVKPGGIIFITIPTQQINPDFNNLVLKEQEIKELLEKRFKIIESFIDKKKFYCVFCQIS